MLKAKRMRTVLQLFAFAACVLLLVTTRVVISARSELQQAEALLVQQDRAAAIVHYRRAARWYAPFSPYHVRALVRMTEIGQAAERTGEAKLALSAYRALRGAILATRSTYVPERARLEAANVHIARLMSQQPPPGVDAGKGEQQLYNEHLALLTPITGPSVPWSCVLLLGFVCWVGSAFALSIRAIDDDERWVRVELVRWAGMIALGLSLFVLGMVLA